MRTNITARVGKLEGRRASAGKRVRHVWRDHGEPKPEAAPGERLVLLSWDDRPEPVAAVERLGR